MLTSVEIYSGIYLKKYIYIEKKKKIKILTTNVYYLYFILFFWRIDSCMHYP